MGTSTDSRPAARWLAGTDRIRRGVSELPALAVVATAIAVGFAYYAGSLVGLALRPPPSFSSLLWLPNAILTATLLLTRSTRRWWIYLAAALPAHLLMLAPTGLPLSFMVAIFLTNCIEALLAAAAVRWLGAAPIRFDTLRHLGLFIAVVVLMAPFVSSFPAAAVVTWWRGDEYWPLWRNRFVSNALSQLMLVPACVVALRDALPMARRASSRRLLEGVLLTGLTLLLGVTVLGSAEGGPLGEGPGLSARFLALLLPPLLWTAVRFGPASTSFSLLSMTVLLLWGETHGRAFLAVLPRQEAALAFQTVLGVVAVPLMCLAALMQEHRRAEELVRGRLEFEKLLSRLSTAFVPLGSHEMDATFERWVARIGESFEVDRFMVLLHRGQEVEIAYSWAAPGNAPLHPARVRSDYPGEVQQILQDQLFVIAQLEAQRAEGVEPAWIDWAGRSLTVPLSARGRTTGVVSLVRRCDDLEWPEELVQRLRLVADVLAGALDRKRAEIEADQSRQELAHLLRISTLGVMTTSLAHELNQPLTAILANAQAAQRMLARTPLDLSEIRDALADTIEEDRRAGEIISHLRDMLRKGTGEHAVIDVRAIVGGVARLASSDALIRKVHLQVSLDPATPAMKGDGTQIQQVVLNLLLNALEAAAESPNGERVVVLRSARAADGQVEISVQDTGPGVPDELAERVFEPFFTTRSRGIGMGLSIARSIVTAHGGTIWVENRTGGGAFFRLHLPSHA